MYMSVSSTPVHVFQTLLGHVEYTYSTEGFKVAV